MLPMSEVTTINVDFNGGIQEHSSDERYVIFSVTDDKVFNMHNYLRMHSIGNKKLIGKFNGVYECSFIINVRDWEKVLESNLLTDQICVLYLWPHAYGYAEYGLTCRKTSLYMLATGAMLDLGCFVAINADELDQYQDWTFDIDAGRYYVIKTKDLKDGSFASGKDA